MSRDEILTAVPDLTEGELDALIRAGVVQPVHSERGPLFRDIDVARLRLILEIEACYDLDGDGLALVMSLIDQLNGMRGDMRAMLRAVATEAPETRARLRRVIRETRVTIDWTE
ncbi:chaperone modulator CbpM [Paracoccus sp. Z118]|nr:chaperone modulator CbpM [Paracoccus sp. Z118]